MDSYRGFGLALLLSSSIIAVFSYFAVGMVPIAATFIGVSIVGASMLLTPESLESKKSERFFFLSWIETVTSIMEALRIGSFNLFVKQNGSVYIIISGKEIEEPQILTAVSPITWVGDSLALILKSPIRNEMIEGESICASAESIIIDRLELADRLECYETEEVVAAKVYAPVYKNARRMLSSFGGTYGIILGSIAAFSKGRGKVEYVEEGSNYIQIKVKMS